MKTVLNAVAAISLIAVAGTANANAFRDAMDRHDNHRVTAVAEQTVRVPAGSVLSSRDLVNENLSADDLISVTSIPSTGVIDRN